MEIPKPNFTSQYPIFSNGFCGCFNQAKPKEKTDCYFYTEVKDMGAHISTCNYHQKLGYCPCTDCKKYIKSSSVFEIVKKYVDEIGDKS